MQSLSGYVKDFTEGSEYIGDLAVGGGGAAAFPDKEFVYHEPENNE